MKQTKSKILAVAAVVLCCALAMGGTLAYYTAESTAHNVITTGDIHIKLFEEFDPEAAKKLVPGNTVDKVVTVMNTSSTAQGDAWIRVQVELDASINGDDLPVAILGPDDLEQPVALIDFNDQADDNWIYGGDGYFYYKTAVAPGEETQPLFTEVTLNPLMDNDYQESRIDVDVYAQAVQAKNNPAPDGDVTRVTGWPK